MGRSVKNEEKQWVFVTDGDEGQSRDAVAAVRGLAVGGYRPAVTVVTQSWLSAPSRYCARRVQVPPVSAEAYVDAVRREMDSGRYLAVIPASEEALVALGVSLPHLLDKSLLAKAAKEVGIPVPPFRFFASGEALLAHAAELDYPVAVKPTQRRSVRSTSARDGR
jgi:hypothetical protein